MADNKNIDNPPRRGKCEAPDADIAVTSSEVSSVAGSAQTAKTYPRLSSSSDRQIKFERAQKCLENAALVSKRIKEHRKATAELLGRPFDDHDGADTASDMHSTISERTGYSAATDTSATLSVQEALNIPGISESLANTLKQKELLMERIKQYKEISKRPMKTNLSKKESTSDIKLDVKKVKENTDVNQLKESIIEKENLLSVIQVKMKAMESTILDLQEKINEKDQIIEAKNKATILMSDSLSKKEMDSMVLLEDTRQQMIKMQENVVSMETEWKEETQKLLKQIEDKDEKITYLEESNKILESSRLQISLQHSKLVEEVKNKDKKIMQLQEKIKTLSQEELQAQTEHVMAKKEEDVEEEKGSKEISDMVELTKKIELLEQLNCQFRQTNKELENKLASVNVEPKTPPTSSPSKKSSPLPTRKGARGTTKKSPWTHLSSDTLAQETEKKSNKSDSKLEFVIQSLNKDILDKEYIISQKDAIITELQATINQKELSLNELKSQTTRQANVVDIGICTEHSSLIQTQETKHIGRDERAQEDTSAYDKELAMKLKTAEDKIAILTNEIEAANRNMIKVKSNHKLKLKQMQKTIENFSKVSDAHAEIIKLNAELHQLSQKVAELEEEKGNLQLHLVDYDSGRLTESDVYKKMVEMENLAETRLKSISVLEAQKFDLVQDLHELRQKNVEMEDKLADMSHLQSEQVSSEIKSVELEEQIDQMNGTIKELELVIENIKLDKEHLEGSVKRLEGEKGELLHKLENYIQENMELTDKLEKLSAEKVSSAESIEIVESLTTQEKLELEEYNKGLSEHKNDESSAKLHVSPECQENMKNLLEQSEELNKKIELFTQERQEVMEKMNNINTENESLHQKISELSNQCNQLQNNLEVLTKEKYELISLNDELNHQLEDLKRERFAIAKEEIVKPPIVEAADESNITEAPHDDKTTGDKSNKGVKTVKQLMKDILKLKNVIKDREAEIGDCQMKILSLEEQQQKHNELEKINASYELKIKTFTEENQLLKDKLNDVLQDKESEKVLLQYKQAQDMLQMEIQKLHQEYDSVIRSRDARIQELEGLLLEYEKQIFNYGNSLEQKDKAMADYINQITKLNDVSQKLKSTIELLEEEKAKDPNAELVKTLNKQITLSQKKLNECEDKLKKLEEEKCELYSLKNALEKKNDSLNSELRKLQDSYAEKQCLIKDLQAQQQKHGEDISKVILELKERDEDIHEIKLQLRKESIENEKLRTTLSEKENNSQEFNKQISETQENVKRLEEMNQGLNEKYQLAETKNKELMEKLKKFAASMKKKSSMYSDLENQLHETQKELEAKNLQIEQLFIEVNALPRLQEKLKYAEEELKSLLSQRASLDHQKSQDIHQLQVETKMLHEQLQAASSNITKLNDELEISQKDLNATHKENLGLKSQLEVLNNKLADYELEQKNNINYVTKITTLEADINQKQIQIAELIGKLENQEQQLSQVQFGQDAKLQERDLYIESLETEINKYKSRICRLEDSISVMEDRRHTLERKADQLGSQLQEKQKAYSEYTSQEDQLVSRLAALIDHDRVLEKQLYEIESENKELQYKAQHFSEENQRLKKSLSEMQEKVNVLIDKASRTDCAESELSKYQTQLHEIEAHLQRINHEHQILLAEKTREIEEIETEFNTQIENAIKEKKVISEKCEKVNERVTELEVQLQEYRNNIEILQINIEELNAINQELAENKKDTQAPDYTEQYIVEINRLNSILNSKNQEVIDLCNKLQDLQNNIGASNSCYENKITELNSKLQQFTLNMENLLQELSDLRVTNEQIQVSLQQKDLELRRLTEERCVSFEMKIPKTEGLVISSTIEPLHGGSKQIDVSSIESQIVPETEPATDKEQGSSKCSEKPQTCSDAGHSGEVLEPVMVAKKAYLCYKGEEENIEQSDDPFNSDEGWGLGESEDISDVTPGLTHLKDQVQQLKQQNETLKTDLVASNNKLIKAMKKLKELKANNEMLAKDLKISQQMSQSSFLDSAVEDELKISIQELEKKVEELSGDINKEKREKDSLRKQNEILHSANERLLEIKEKLDSETEMWKYKFKEANDKLSTVQWDADSKDSRDNKPCQPARGATDEALKEEIAKLEKENDELQSVIEQLTNQNKELFIQQTNLKTQVDDLNRKQIEIQSENSKQDSINNELTVLRTLNLELQNSNDDLNQKLCDLEVRNNEILQKYENVKTILTETQDKNAELLDNTRKFEDQITHLTKTEAEANNKLTVLMSELETTKLKLLWHEQEQKAIKSQAADTFALSEKLISIEDHSLQLKHDLDIANNKILHLESQNNSLIEELTHYKQQVDELNAKMHRLNLENDQLLSTVAELRSSISSAVDQRGYEIAELWKQHLAQRESDFQKIEQDLRNELSAIETKYEQLLDSVQSSSQEETSKLVALEQLTSLQNKLQDKDEHLRNLQDKLTEVMNQTDMLRSELEDEKIMHESKLLTQQEEYEKQIKELSEKTLETSKSYDVTYNNLQSELALTKTANDELHQQIQEVLDKVEKSERQVIELTNQLRMKDTEIFQKTHDYTTTLTQKNEDFENIRKQLLDYEKKIEDLSFEKESELAVLRLKMHQQGQDFDRSHQDSEEEKLSLTQELNAKIVECTNLNKKVSDLNKTLEKHTNNAAEMQAALESQELEIVTLKDEITNLLRSSKMEKHVTFASDTKPGAELQDKSPEELSQELLERVPRAELDLALYMLHQRDVRCEELTMELTQLLDERDTLQLRLSDSLRSCEELKTRCKAAGLELNLELAQEAAAELPTFAVEKEQKHADVHRGQSSRSSSISDPDGEKPKLQAKLSELRSVKQSRDVRLRQDSEQRQLALRLLSRDVAHLPPEAREQLAQAHHTLSRDSQSTPTVLLNWLRGKSTPKVVHM